MIYIAKIEIEYEEEKNGNVVNKKKKEEYIIEDAVSCVDVEAQITDYLSSIKENWRVIKIEEKPSVIDVIRKK